LADEKLRKLEREAASDPEAEKKLQRARLRAGILKHVWVIKYTTDGGVGLDGALIGLFTTREACIDHIKKHEKGFHPGYRGSTGWGNKNRDESFHTWTNGYRELEIQKVPVCDGPTDEWFAAHN